MRRRIPLYFSVWVALLATPACAAHTGAQAATATSTWQQHMAQAVPAPGYDWSGTQQEAGTARLIYGQRDSDDVPLEMICQLGGGEIELMVMTAGEGPSVMELMTPDTHLAIPANTAWDSNFNMTLQRARLDSHAPILASIARHQAVAVNAYNKWQALLPQPGTVIGIDHFLSLCHKQG